MGEYDEQLKRSWKTGDFTVHAAAASYEAAAGDGVGLRARLRGEIERIVVGESEDPTQDALGNISEDSCPECRCRDAAGRRPGGSMKLAKFVKFREEKFGGVLFETRNEKVYTLNPTGAAVVREIVAGAEDVVGGLKARYEDKTGRMEREAYEFLADLKSKGLVE